VFLVALLFALFANVFTIAKYGLEYSQPFFLVGSRMLLAGILMIGYQYWKDSSKLALKKIDLLPLFLLALFNIYLTNAFEFWGLQYLTSSKTCLIYSLSPFAAALLSYVMFREKMTVKKWLGLLVGMAGFAPILITGSPTEDLLGHFLFFSWAELAVVAAALSSVYGWILLRKLVNDNQLSPMVVNGYSMALGGVMALVNSAALEDWDPIPVTEMMPFLQSAILLIVISNFICYNLYGHLLKTYSATFLSFAGFMTPLFAAFFGWLYLGEEVSWAFYASATVIFAGLLLFYSEELRQKSDVYREAKAMASDAG
jgi:drug/metabolite transporter (DMT)-like permease